MLIITAAFTNLCTPVSKFPSETVNFQSSKMSLTTDNKVQIIDSGDSGVFQSLMDVDVVPTLLDVPGPVANSDVLSQNFQSQHTTGQQLPLPIPHSTPSEFVLPTSSSFSSNLMQTV